MNVTMTLEEYTRLKDEANAADSAKRIKEYYRGKCEEMDNDRLRWEDKFVTLQMMYAEKMGITTGEVWEMVKEEQKK